jgi:hypothetical protein
MITNNLPKSKHRVYFLITKTYQNFRSKLSTPYSEISHITHTHPLPRFINQTVAKQASTSMGQNSSRLFT